MLSYGCEVFIYIVVRLWCFCMLWYEVMMLLWCFHDVMMLPYALLWIFYVVVMLLWGCNVVVCSAMKLWCCHDVVVRLWCYHMLCYEVAMFSWFLCEWMFPLLEVFMNECFHHWLHSGNYAMKLARVWRIVHGLNHAVEFRGNMCMKILYWWYLIELVLSWEDWCIQSTSWCMWFREWVLPSSWSW